MNRRKFFAHYCQCGLLILAMGLHFLGRSMDRKGQPEDGPLYLVMAIFGAFFGFVILAITFPIATRSIRESLDKSAEAAATQNGDTAPQARPGLLSVIIDILLVTSMGSLITEWTIKAWGDPGYPDRFKMIVSLVCAAWFVAGSVTVFETLRDWNRGRRQPIP